MLPQKLFCNIPSNCEVHLRKSCIHKVFIFTEDGIYQLVISWTPATSHLYFYVMPWSVLLATRYFNLYLFRWQHWEMRFACLFHKFSSGSSIVSIFFVQTQTVSSSIWVGWFILVFLLLDVCGWSCRCAIFQYSVGNFL